MGSESSKNAERYQAVIFGTFDFDWKFCAKQFFQVKSPLPNNKSPIFEQPDVKCKWFLKIDRDSSPDGIQIWLCLQDSPAKPILVDYALALKGDNDTKPMHEVRGSHVFHNSSAQSEKSFLIRNDKETPLDNLVIHVRIDAEIMRKGVTTPDISSFSQTPSVQQDSETERQQNVTSELPNKLSTDLKDLLRCEKHSDVRINVNGYVLNAHRCLLSCRSSYFDRMFEKDVNGTRTDTDVEDFDPETFFKFLDFVYSGTSPEFTYDSAVQLLRASNTYDVVDLKESCQTHLIENMDVNNAFSLLQCASDFNAF